MEKKDLNFKNEVLLRGELLANCTPFTDYSGKSYFKAFLSVKRLSNTYDIIPIYIPESMFFSLPSKTIYIEVSGSFVSHNANYNGQSHLELYVLPEKIIPLEKEEYYNEIYLIGKICKKSVIRSTPSGKIILDFILATQKSGISSYLPIIAWNHNAINLSRLNIGVPISIYARIQSRTYIKKYSDSFSEEKTAYEISLTSFNYL